MSKFEKGHLYRNNWDTYYCLYLVVDDNGGAIRFKYSDSEYYIYDGCINLISESLLEVNCGFRLFWSLYSRIASDAWRLCLILGDQIPTTGIAFPDMDGVLERIMTRQEESQGCDYRFLIDDFDVLGSFFFNGGKVHYRSYMKGNMIFEKILE